MKANIYFIIATLFLGLNFHLSKIVLAEVSFIEAISWRFTLAGITLFLLAYKNLKSLQLKRSSIKGAALVGGIGLLGFNVFLFLGLRNSSAINAALIIGLNPAITVLLSSIILKTSLKTKHLIGIIISFSGVMYLISKGNITSFQDIDFNYSDVLILIANIFFALHHVWVKKYSSELENTSFTFLAILFTLIGILVFLPFVEIQEIASHSTKFWFAISGLGILGTGVVFYFWNYSVQKAGADQAGIFMNMVPLFTALFAVFFNEYLYRYHFISALFIISGMLIMKINNRKMSYYSMILKRKLKM
ncbi:MAG: DMT family transporter [Psychroserpens sp.]|uniref:DMT family transporter n=1 Tax=Psychroserpens sp. TaxID=2020870 RepID=UPI003003626B